MQDEKFLVAPEAVGINPERLDELRQRAKKEVEEGLLPSAQIAIARKGKIAHFETFGDATNDSLYCIFSATKAITSAAAWILIQAKQLDTTRTVASVIKEFASNEKDQITIEQLFTHTAGFPHAPFRVSDWFEGNRRTERFNEWTLNWAPGSRYEYHPTSSMWVIAELIERITNRDFGEFVREEIVLPLGLPDMWLGAPDEVHGRVAEICHVGKQLTADDYKQLGMNAPPITEVTPEVILNFNKPETRRVPVPGGGGIMSAAELALFYQGLLGQIPGSREIWTSETITAATTPLTGDLKDMWTGQPVNRALGVVISGDAKRNFRGFGHTNSPAAFGHAGAGGQIAWADPATGISFAYCTNGHDLNTIRESRRGISLSNKAAVCAEQ